MKEKQAYQKILNYLLFNGFSKPHFGQNNVPLSNNFIELQNLSCTEDDSFNHKLTLILKTILENLTASDRQEIINTLYQDQLSYKSLLLFFYIEHGNSFKISDKDISLEFNRILVRYT